jgi:hypothetical protein
LLDQWELGDGSNSLGGDGLNLFLKALNGLFLFLDSLATGEIGEFLGNRGNSLLKGLN